MHALSLLSYLILLSEQTRNVAVRSVAVHLDLFNSKESFVNALCDQPRNFVMRFAEVHFDFLNSKESFVNALSDQPKRMLCCTPLRLILICLNRRNLSSMRFAINNT